MGGKITKAVLEQEAPEWKWKAKHDGSIGWEYIGRKNGNTVRVYAVAMCCGPAEDDYSTQWRVDDGQTSQPYIMWIFSRKRGKHGR